MVVVAQLFATAPVREKMASIKIFQQSWRFFIPCERYSVGRRNGRRNRREHQDVLILRFRAAEDLAGEVLKNVLLALAKRLLERRAAAAQVLAQKHQRCNPPFALAMDAFQVVRVKLAASEYCLGFLGRAAQLDLVDARDPAARDEPRELRRRIRARQHHQRNAFGDLLEPLREGCASLGLRPHLLKVVENDRARKGQHGEKIAEEAAREASEILLRLGSEQG